MCDVMNIVMFFFFKQKTAYDMRISDWSSDVCSSDLIERVLLLEGVPNLQDLGKLKIGETVPEGLQANLDLERKGRGDLQAAIAHCEAVQDYVSRQILTEILDDTEEHIDHLETQLDLVEKVGVQNHLQSQKIGRAHV